ncbi:MAG: hypothetical protein RLZZ227_2898 [Pseudomonadota bacterium]|jgi:hypothetical protein
MSTNAGLYTDPSADRDTLLRRMLTPAPLFELIGPHDRQRAAVEAIVAEKFQAAWQANVTHFLPWLLSMQCLGHCSAVAGLRPAAGAPLFLEQYLEQPVNIVLSQRVGQLVPRGAIVEVGNLAASQRGASHVLFLVMTAVLHDAGFKWITFTATRALRNNLDKFGYPLLKLADARPAQLDAAELGAWGSYYASEPMVMAGSLDVALDLIHERPLMRHVLNLYRRQIEALADRLRRA